jgi:undecaprenyl-diphosphatase
LLHWLLATLGGWLLALMLNALMGLVLGRPDVSGSVGQVPHVDFVLAVLVLGFAALIVAKDFRPRQRKWLYLTSVALLALIAFSQFYLARATVNGLVAGLALAMGWLALTGIGYRSRATPYASPGWRLIGFSTGWLLVSLVYIPQHYAQFARHHELAQPTRELEASAWWNDSWQSLPALRSRIGRGDRQRFDAQLALGRDALEQALAAGGWRRPPEASLRALRTLFGDAPAPARLFHLPRDFAGQPEDLMRRRILEDGRAVLIRAWDSGARLKPAGTPVWLVQARVLTPVKRLGMLNTWREVDGSAELALDQLRDIGADWRWRRPPGSESPWLMREAAGE